MRTVLLFVSTISLIGVLSFSESRESVRERERMERRRYNNFPSLRSDTVFTFPQSFDSWANDHFGLRSYLISLQALVHRYLLRDLPNSRYIMGKDGWFFRGIGRQRGADGSEDNYNDLLDITGRAQFREDELNLWIKRLRERKRLIESRGGKFLWGVGPRKATVYPELLPALLERSRGRTRLEQLSDRLKQELPEIFVDLPTALREAKSVGAYPRLYYRTDAHWNYYGAYFAYRAFMTRASAFIPGLDPRPLQEFRIGERTNWYHRGFLSETRIVEKESFPILYPKADSPYAQLRVINAKAGYVEEGSDEIAQGNARPLPEVGIGVADMPNHRLKFIGKKRSGGCRYLRNDSSGLPLTDLILIGDSFLQKAAPFFAAHAKHTYFCRQTAALTLPIFDKKRNEKIQTQLVIQEITETYLGRGARVSR